MNFEQLKEKFPEATKETWHQHPNGKGWVENTASVDETVFVGENALVFEDARVSDKARVYGDARVSGDAQVSGGKWKVSPLFIQGTEHPVCICKPGVIRIGCEEHSIDEWLENYRAIGEKNKYSSNEIKEYGLFIKFISDNKAMPSISGK